jgi:hypothetical protein
MTTNTPHTPGPWNADKNFMGPDTYSDGNSIPVFPRGGGVAICDVVAVTGEGLSRPDVQARAEANARLIAAAPDLLAVLEAVAVWTDAEPCFCHVHNDSERARYSPHNFLCDCARTAILKAKGDAK